MKFNALAALHVPPIKCTVMKITLQKSGTENHYKEIAQHK